MVEKSLSFSEIYRGSGYTSLGYSAVLREQLMVVNRLERKVNLKFVVITLTLARFNKTLNQLHVHEYPSPYHGLSLESCYCPCHWLRAI